MICHLLTHVLLWLSLFSFIFGNSEESLKLVSVLFRHGDRTPIHMLNNDPNNASTWPEGLGQLTPVGVKHSHELGKYLRSLYGDEFLSRTYKAEEIYVLSSNVDRTLMTAQAVMAGFYCPPEGKQLWSEDLPWFPIPVHTEGSEGMVHFEDVNNSCSNLREALTTNIETSDLYHQLINDTDLGILLYNYTGIPMKQLLNPHKPDSLTLGGIHDTLLVEKLNNRRWPDWVTDELYQVLDDAYPILFSQQYSGDVLSKYKGGVLLNKMNTDMQLKSEDKLDMKMFVYSGHDSTILALLCALKLYDNKPIHYNSLMMVELHYTEEQNYFVRLYQKRDYNASREELTLPGCDFDCPLDMFINITDVSVNGMRMCHNPDLFQTLIDDMTSMFYILIGCSFIILVTCILFVLCCYKRSKSRRASPSLFNTNATNGRTLRVQSSLESVPMINADGNDSDLSDEWNS